MSDIEKISNADNLVLVYHFAQMGSNWKESVQRYGMDLLFNVYDTQKRIRNGTYKQLPFYEFNLNERGKTRHIKSLHISDRVVQRSTCDNVLIPSLYNYLIYDNGASLKNKGISFTRKRLVKHLSDYYRKYGKDGYILQIDFSKFFDNISHSKLIESMAEKMQKSDAMDLIYSQIAAFKVDVSYLTDAQFENYDSVVFNSIEHNKIDKDRLTGKKFLNRSVGIGSQTHK